jgi:heme/copper-type cytochrome/quinol oxidase subunit 2
MDQLGSSEILIIFFIVFGVVLIPGIFFLLTQQNTLKEIHPQNRTMSPGEVWLQLIPLFNIVWSFIVVSRIAESLKRELASQASFSFETSADNSPYQTEEKPTYQIGMALFRF